jgi:MFS family permease
VSRVNSALPRAFHFFLGTRLLSAAALQMMLVALGWQMYDLTAQAWDLGLVGLVQFVPALLLTIPAGLLVDRVDRRAVLAASLVLYLVVALALTWASAGGWITREFILMLSAVVGVARAMGMPSQQALVPLLVTREELPRAVATSSGAMQIAIIGGPALGGFIYVAGAAVVYATCSALLVASIAFTAFIRHRAAAIDREPVSLQSLFAGFGFMWREKVVLGAISLDLFAVILGGAVALLPIYAKDVLHTGPWGLGLLRCAPALGALTMSVVLSRAPLAHGVGRKMFAAVAVWGVAMLVFAVSKDFALSFAALVVSGAADMVSVVIRLSLVQLETPDEMRGRVSAVNATFIGASNQLGEFRAGAIAQWLGPVASVVMGSVGTLMVVALWMRMFPMLAKRETLRA